jgi:hypothetical protein
MHRWTPINPQQLHVLKRLSADDDISGPDDAPARHSATALHRRGLITITKHGGHWHATVTDAGTFYLHNGHHPDRPTRQTHSRRLVADPPAIPRQPTPRPAQKDPLDQPAPRKPPHTTAMITEQRRDAATALVARLHHEPTVLIPEPSSADVTYWRTVVDFAKRHKMTPDGHRLELRHERGDLTISLVAGHHANSRRATTAWKTPAPEAASPSDLHPAVADLRDNPTQLRMPGPLRRRSLLILHLLATEATHLGHVARAKPRERYESIYTCDGEIIITAAGFDYPVTVSRAPARSDDPPACDRLVIELSFLKGERQQYRWGDCARHRTEDRVPAVVHQITVRAAADTKRQQQTRQREAERRAREQRAAADAARRAIQTHYADTLITQLENWQYAAQLRIYCDAMEKRIQAEANADAISAATQWLAWGRNYIEKLDPLTTLPTMPPWPQPREKKPAAELKPSE